MMQSWNAADIDADLRQIGHGIHVEAGVNGADVERRRSQMRMRRHVELKCLQSREDTRGLVGSIDAEMRHRSMGGDALYRQAEPERALVADQCCIRRGLGHDDRAGTAERKSTRLN